MLVIIVVNIMHRKEQKIGLSEKEVIVALEKFGYNELPKSRRFNVFKILFEIVRDPMFVLLILGGLLYLVLGDKQEAIMLLGFVFLIIGVSFVQQNKTEKALDKLKDLSTPKTLVIRNGETIKISSREVVPGDLIIISEGDYVTADAYIIENYDVMVNESLLTGESVPVRKTVYTGGNTKLVPGGDDLTAVFSGTIVTRGRAVAKVFATGLATQIGEIGKSLESIREEDSDLKKQTSEVVKIYAFVGLLMCAGIILIFGIWRADWLKGLLAGITLAMSILPEEFPVVLTIFLTMGAWRMSQKKVLARKSSAIEFLGKATVLCSDKTGTITENKMVTTDVFYGESFYKIGDVPKVELEYIAKIAYYATPYESSDPMDKAIFNFGKKYDNRDLYLMREYEFSHELLAMSRVFEVEENKILVATKGAPEAVMDLCHFSEEEKLSIKSKIDSLASQGVRVIALASSELPKDFVADKQHDYNLKFVGLLGLTDPVRKEIPDAVRECHEAGVRVMMITGDYSLTAINIAKQIGLENPEQIIVGAELEKMSEVELLERIKTVNVFARIVPGQKLRIVNVLKASGEVVAMTGDGVNDAPALKAADIGIAMGERGTDVAREASSLVLLDDNFNSIVSAIRMGRRIYDNIRKAITYIFSVHIPIALMSFIPPIFGLPLILLPMHIVFMEMIIDPSCSIVFEMEKEEANTMKRRPRSSREKLFNKRMVLLGLFQGLVAQCFVLLAYVISIKSGLGDNEVRTVTFATLLLSNVGLVFVNRSDKGIWGKIYSDFNKSFLVISAIAVIALLATIFVPYLRDVFDFAEISWEWSLLVIVLSSAGVLCAEMVRVNINKYCEKRQQTCLV